MSRGNRILAAALIVQVVLAVLVFWPRSASTAGAGGNVSAEPLFEGLAADQFVRLTIKDPGGEQIVLAKAADGWVLPEMDDYPCSDTTISDLVTKIVELKVGRPVTQTPASHKRLKVSEQDFVRLIEFSLADGSSHELYLGSSPSYGAIHVRVGGQDQVYLASDLSTAEAPVRPASWVDTLYFSVPSDQVVSVTLDNAHGHFEFAKDDGGTWTMQGLAPDETFDEAGFTSLVSGASSVRLIRPLGKEIKPDYGVDEPQAVIVVRTREAEGTAKAYVLQVGAKSDEDQSYVLKSSESPYYVRVAQYVAQDWVEKTREGFLEQPPTPEPAATPSS
jgi:hypothetical protein